MSTLKFVHCFYDDSSVISQIWVNSLEIFHVNSESRIGLFAFRPKLFEMCVVRKTFEICARKNIWNMCSHPNIVRVREAVRSICTLPPCPNKTLPQRTSMMKYAITWYNTQVSFQVNLSTTKKESNQSPYIATVTKQDATTSCQHDEICNYMI